jgi:hypothetical protein
MLPMRLELIDQLAVPVNVHRRIVARTTRRRCASDEPDGRSGRRWRSALDGSGTTITTLWVVRPMESGR